MATSISVLCVIPWAPWPLRSGGKYRVANVLEELCRREDLSVSIVVPTRNEDRHDTVSRLYAWGAAEVHPVTSVAGTRGYLEHLRLLPTRTPGSMVYRNSALTKVVGDLVSENDYQVLQVEFLAMAHVIDAIGNSRIATFLTSHFPASASYRRNLQVYRALSPMWFYTLIDYAKMGNYERGMHRRFDRVFVTSEEHGELCSGGDDESHVIAKNAVDVDFFQPSGGGGDRGELVISTCSFASHANVDGVLFFLSKVWPKVSQLRPGATYKIIGSGAPEAVRRMARITPGAEFVGEVPDVRPYFDNARASVVCMRAGGGTKIRLMTSLAMGVPVVATPLGAEGISLSKDLEGVVVSSDVDELAHALVGYLAAPLAPLQGLRDVIAESFTWRQTVATMVESYRALL